MGVAKYISFRGHFCTLGFLAGTATVLLLAQMTELVVQAPGATLGALGVVAAPLLGWIWHTRRRDDDASSPLSQTEIMADVEEVAPLGWWSLNLETGAMKWSPALYRILALDPAHVSPSIHAALRHVPPSDRGVLLDLIRDLLRHTDDEAATAEMCVRLQRTTGETRVLRLRLRLHKDDQNHPCYLVGLCMDLTATLSHVANLSAVTEEAMAVTRIKQVLLDNINHEIRTPLTSILGFAEILTEEVAEEHRGFLQHIEHNGRRLLTTMTALLNLAYLEGTSATVLEGKVDAAALLRNHLGRYRDAAHHQGLTFHASIPSRVLPVPIAPVYLEQLLDHLLGNALKFTPHGCVTVTLREEEEMVRIDIKDTGIGISDSFLPHLFEAFQQESGGRTREFEGSGLGLAVVKHIVDAVGGRITVTSHKARGSTFTIMLPLCTPPVLTEAHHLPPPTKTPFTTTPTTVYE